MLASLALAVILSFTVRLVLIERSHFAEHGHLMPLGLHADMIVHYASIGIPGVTKMYEAEITNFGLLPVSVARCEFISDTLTPGTMIAYDVERWDRSLSVWKTAVDFSGPHFCTPVPLSMAQTRLVTKWLWPGQSLTTGEEATAARDAFQKGDAARFVLYAGTNKSELTPTAGFLIDEKPSDEGVPFRVRH